MQEIFIVGIGMGNVGGITLEARQMIESCGAIAGAGRMLELVDHFNFSNPPKLLAAYQPEKIKAWAEEIEEKRIAILLSGDVGFYSGAKQFQGVFHKAQLHYIPGISSVVYFCSKLQLPWEDVCLASLHGRTCNAIQLIQRNPKTFFLLSGAHGLQTLSEKLKYYHLEQVLLHVGQRLSYANEKIQTLQVEEWDERQWEGGQWDNLLVVLVENPNAKDYVQLSIADADFIRDQVPMTKQEVRTVAIGKLGLTKDAVVYDIGAGSGSVAIEIALQSPYIQVYAIEKEPLACAVLEKNRQKFAADNVEIQKGFAPDRLADLPAPTHVFIGGSSGKMQEILQEIFGKNPRAKVVLDTVSLDTLNAILNLAKQHRDWQLDVTQLQVAKARQLGNYQMMMGQNPVYVIAVTVK